MRSFSAFVFLVLLCVAATFGVALAQESDETPPFPGDVSPSGLAAIAAAGDSTDSTNTNVLQSVMPEFMTKEVRTWLNQTYDVRGGHALTRMLTFPMGPRTFGPTTRLGTLWERRKPRFRWLLTRTPS